MMVMVINVMLMVSMLIVTLMLMALMMMLMLMMHGEVNVNDIYFDGNDDSAINLGGSEGEDNVGEISWKGGVMKISHLHHRYHIIITKDTYIPHFGMLFLQI